MEARMLLLQAALLLILIYGTTHLHKQLQMLQDFHPERMLLLLPIMLDVPAQNMLLSLVQRQLFFLQLQQMHLAV